MSLLYAMQGAIPMFHGQSSVVAATRVFEAGADEAAKGGRTKADGSTRKSIKHVATADEARVKRMDTTIQLRKDSRESAFAKRRRGAGVDLDSSTQLTPEQAVAELPKWGQAILKAADPGSSLRAVNQLRHALEQTDQLAMRSVFEIGGLLQRFADILGTPNLPFELYDEIGEVVQLLTVGASLDQTLLLIKMGFLTLLLPLLRPGGSASGLGSACCFYGNVLSENSATRKAVLNEGVLQLLLQLVHANQVPCEAMETVMWFFAMLAYSRPAVEWAQMKAMLPILATVIRTYAAETTAADTSSSSSSNAPPTLTFSDATVDHAVMALHYIVGCSKLERHLKANVDVVESVQALNVTPSLVQLLGFSKKMKNTVRHAVACLEFMSGGNLQQILRVLDADFLRSEHVCSLLVHGSRDVKNSIAMILNRVTRDPDQTIPRFIQSGLVPVVLGCLDDPSESPRDMLFELAYVLRNLLALGHDHAMLTAVDHGALQTLMRMLDSLDVIPQYDVLSAVQRVLQFGDALMERSQADTNRFADILRECEGVHVLEQLHLYTEERADYLSAGHEELSTLVHEILLEWFDEGDMASQDLAAAVAASSTEPDLAAAPSSSSSSFFAGTQPASAAATNASAFSFAPMPMFAYQQQPPPPPAHAEACSSSSFSSAPSTSFMSDC
jgi:hypothetical protein